MVATAEKLSFSQPGNDPIVLSGARDQVGRYHSVQEAIDDMTDQEVSPHIVANLVHGTYRSSVMPVEDIAQAAIDLQTADDLVRLVPRTPIIYRLHCADAVGLTPDEATEGFSLVNTYTKKNPHFQTVIPVQKLYSVRRGPNFEDNERFVENTDMRMYQVRKILTSDDPQTRAHFLDYRSEWSRYPYSRIVVGSVAVDSFLKDQARRDLTGEEGVVDGRGFVNSWALLASAGLKKAGYDSPLGKEGDIAYKAGVENLALVVASGLGYRPAMFDWPTGPDNVLRRLRGIEFVPERDAPIAGEKAAERLFNDEDDYRSHKFMRLLYGDRGQLTSYLTETAGNFLTRFVSSEA